MPELPEVETVKNQLWHALQDKKIKSVTLNRQNLRFPLPENFTPLLTGAVCQTISRHGKYILMGLDNNMTLLIHLGMTGRFVMGDTYMQLPDFYHHYALNPIHEHIIFITECNMRVGYYDPRRFGYMDIFPTAHIKQNRFIKMLGTDALNIAARCDDFILSLSKIKTSIKNTLLNQSVLAGVGNIYASEALWRAGIPPKIPSCNISADKIKILSQHIEDILYQAIHAGGSTLKDYRSPDGKSGSFQHQFDVYDRAGLLCHKNDGGMIEKTIISGRSTYHCPVCQS
jgi:formamidopyrimidine-DNA glycosylase